MVGETKSLDLPVKAVAQAGSGWKVLLEDRDVDLVSMADKTSLIL